MLQPGEQTIECPYIPHEADPDTLVIRPLDDSIDVLEWGGNPFSCKIKGSSSGRRALEFIYRVQGMNWWAHYEARLRGTGLSQTVSADLSVSVTIQNKTSGRYEDTRIRLVGGDGAPNDSGRHGPGFLMLDPDSPLADLWRVSPSAPPVYYTYPLSGRRTLPANSDVRVPFLRVQGVKARYLLSHAFGHGAGSGRICRRGEGPATRHGGHLLVNGPWRRHSVERTLAAHLHERCYTYNEPGLERDTG